MISHITLLNLIKIPRRDECFTVTSHISHDETPNKVLQNCRCDIPIHCKQLDDKPNYRLVQTSLVS